MLLQSDCLVMDASVLINIIASGDPNFFLDDLVGKILVPSIVLAEITAEKDSKRNKQAPISTLLQLGAIVVPEKRKSIDAMAVSIAGAPTPDNLDDGEAYAIAYALEFSATLAIDETKGRRIIAKYWPHLKLISSLELMEHVFLKKNAGSEFRKSLLFSTLNIARMQIPRNRRLEMIELLGPEKAASCPSLGNGLLSSISINRTDSVPF